MFRIPGWAKGKENPFNSYYSSVSNTVSLKANNTPVNLNAVNGYAVIKRAWKRGMLNQIFPLSRGIYTRWFCKYYKNEIATAAGPAVYGFETIDNTGLNIIAVSSWVTQNQ